MTTSHDKEHEREAQGCLILIAIAVVCAGLFIGEVTRCIRDATIGTECVKAGRTWSNAEGCK